MSTTYDFYVDEKVTMWRRVNVTVEAESYDEAVGRIIDGSYDEGESEYLYDTEDSMSSESNQGRATLEVYDNVTDKLIYDNKDRLG